MTTSNLEKAAAMTAEGITLEAAADDLRRAQSDEFHVFGVRVELKETTTNSRGVSKVWSGKWDGVDVSAMWREKPSSFARRWFLSVRVDPVSGPDSSSSMSFSASRSTLAEAARALAVVLAEAARAATAFADQATRASS